MTTPRGGSSPTGFPDWHLAKPRDPGQFFQANSQNTPKLKISKGCRERKNHEPQSILTQDLQPDLQRERGWAGRWREELTRRQPGLGWQLCLRTLALPTQLPWVCASDWRKGQTQTSITVDSSPSLRGQYISFFNSFSHTL